MRECMCVCVCVCVHLYSLIMFVHYVHIKTFRTYVCIHLLGTSFMYIHMYVCTSST